MKDPLDKKKRAYELLNIDRHATLPEINAVYARLCAEDPSKRQELTNAWQRLRRADTRLEEDFWYYNIAKVKTIDRVNLDMSDTVLSQPVLPPDALEVGLECTELANELYRNDFRPIEFEAIRLNDIEGYDEEPALAVPIIFDR